MSRDRALGAALLLTVSSLVVQPFVVAATTEPYSVRDQAISDLGVTSCGLVPGTTGDVPVCSPWWPLMGAGIVLGGLAFLAVALLLRRAGLAGRATTVLLVVTGLSTLGAGLVPLDVSRAWHVALAVPLFPAQALAAPTLARDLRRRGARPPVPALLVVAGVLGAAGSLAVVLPLGVPFGVAERLGAYPLPVTFALLGASVLVGRPRRSAGSAWHQREDAP